MNGNVTGAGDDEDEEVKKKSGATLLWSPVVCRFSFVILEYCKKSNFRKGQGKDKEIKVGKR